MSKHRLLSLLLTTVVISYSFALEISMESAKDNFIKYSTLQLSDKDKFTCDTIQDDFNNITKIVCAFSKKPLQPIHNIQNDFFKVDTLVKKGVFFLQITPFYKAKLIADIFDLTKDDSVFKADNVSLSHQWTIIGYKDTLPLLKEEKNTGLALNFPFYFAKDKLPFVGSLDIKGNPVYIKKVGDVKEYLRVKKLFEEKKYDLCLESIEDILYKYPNTLFKAELLYYKIKVYSKIKDFDNVVANAKIFLREYSSDENIPEVLSLMAKAYNDLGQNSDADYFFDRLFSEHPNSVYTYWGYIYKGEGLEASGGDSHAIEFYKKALYGTKDVDVAVSAAYHLAHIYLSYDAKKASKYIEKIIKIKPSYLLEDFKTSKDMMYEFADRGAYKTAADMAKAILDAIDPTYDEYEEMLKNWGLWLSKTKDKKEALDALNRYLKAFPDGDYVNAVQIAKDALFFELDDLNTSAKLTQYNLLIDEYGKDSIGQRALYEKAKLLLANKHYNDVLALKDQLESLDTTIYEDVEDIIKQAAVGAMEDALEKRECKAVLDISSRYQITLSNKWDDGIYVCAMKGGDFQLSKEIATRHLQSKNIEQRKEWLYRYIKVDFETGNYSELIDASKDLIALLEPSDKKYFEVYRYLFDAYERLGQKENMIDAMMQIEKVFGLSYKDLDRYSAMVTLAQELHDDNMLIEYAKKVLKIQKKAKAYPQSPYVDFALYQAYMNKNEYTNALEVIRNLDKVKLSKEQRARQKYLLGVVLDKLWKDNEAKKAYKAAIKADKDSAWAKLAQSALEL